MKFVGFGWMLAVGAFVALVPSPPEDNSVAALLGTQNAETTVYEAFRSAFGNDEVIVVSVEGGELRSLLDLVVDLTKRLDEDPLTTRTLSPALLHAGAFDVLRDEDLGGLGELARLRSSFGGPLDRELQLFDPDSPRARIFALGPVAPPKAREGLARDLAAFKERAERAGHKLQFAGNPLINLELDRASRRVETRSLPLLFLVCVLFLWLTTRSLRLTVVSLLPSGLGVAAADGLLWLSGRTTNIVVEIAKPLLLVVLLAAVLHLVVEFQARLRSGESRKNAAWGAAKEKAKPTLLAFVTTAAGFGSLVVADVEPIRTFGLLSAVSIAFSVPLVLLSLPALLATVGGGRGIEGESSKSAQFAERVVAYSLRKGLRLPAAALVAVVIGFFALSVLEVDPHAIHYFSEAHPLRQDHEALEASGLGLATVEAVVTATRTIARDEAFLERLNEFMKAARSLPGVRAAVGLPLFVREASFRASRTESIGAGLALEDLVGAEAVRLDDFVSDDGTKLRVSMIIGTLDRPALRTLEVQLREAFRHAFRDVPREAAPDEGRHNPTLELTGNYGLLLRAQESLISTLGKSLLASTLLMELILLLALRSFRLALIALLPNVLPACLNAVLMAIFRIPLDIGTSMTASVALGIAVEDTLHFVAAWRSSGIRGATERTGRAIVLASLVIGAGFFSLLASDFDPARNFGLLCGTAMVGAFLADLLVLPPLLSWLDRRSSKPDSDPSFAPDPHSSDRTPTP